VGEKGHAAEVPVFTSQEVYNAGVDVPLADLPAPGAMASLLVGAANVSDKAAACVATLYARNGNRLTEVPFEVEPMSVARENVLAHTAKRRVAAVRVTCDQSFYPLAVATERGSRQVVYAKAVGPNGPCTYTVALEQQPNGNYTASSPLSVFHDATRNNPKGIICLRAPKELRIARATFEWEVVPGPWAQRNRSGVHNLAYIFLDRYRSGVVGNVNALGPNKNLLKFMQNVGMPRGKNTNVKGGHAVREGQTYRFVYTFDAANRRATLQAFTGGVSVSTISAAAQPGAQTLVLKPYAPIPGSPGGLAMVAEFGNYNNQHAPEMPTWFWKYSNFKVTMVPK
jgi:hypothetical protein